MRFLTATPNTLFAPVSLMEKYFLFKFYDLEELFRTGGQVPDTSYIFMVIV